MAMHPNMVLMQTLCLPQLLMLALLLSNTSAGIFTSSSLPVAHRASSRYYGCCEIAGSLFTCSLSHPNPATATAHTRMDILSDLVPTVISTLATSLVVLATV